MADGNQIEVLNPQGQAGNIPLEQMDDALGQGYKLSKHAIMFDQNGKRGLVPKEQMADAMKAGYQTTPETSFEKERKPAPEDTGWWGRTKQFGKDIGGMATGLLEPLGHPGLPDFSQAPRMAADAAQRQDEGRSTPYQALAGGAGLAGIDPTGMEESARHGDPTGVLTHAAAQAAPVLVAEATRLPIVRRAGERIGARLGERSLAKSTREIKEAAPPGRHEINYDAQLERAKPYLAEEQRSAPVKTVREAHETANSAIKGIEDKIGSYIDQLPETDRISGQDILDRATAKLNDPNSPRTPAEHAAGMRALEEFLTDEIPPQEEGGEPTRQPKDLSVKETDRLRWRFNRDMDTEMGMTEADRADVRASNPRFAAKEAAAEAMRDAVYDKLEAAGVPGVREIRGDEGAVIQMRDAFRRNITRSEKSNAPSAMRRLGVFGPVGLGLLGETLSRHFGAPPGISTAMGLGSAGLYEYMRGRMQPNPLMERGMGRLGRSGLAPSYPTMPIQGQIVPEPTAAGAAPPIAREVPPDYPQLTEYAGRQPGAPPPVTTGAKELVGEPEEKILAQRRGVRQPIRGALAAPAVPPEPTRPPNAAGNVEGTGRPTDERTLARGGGIRQPVRGLLPEESGQTTPPKAEPPAIKLNRGTTTVGRGGRTATKPTPQMMKTVGLKLRGEYPEGYYDFQDMQTGGTIAAPKAGFDEKALIEKVKAHRQAMRQTPAEGKSDVAKTKQEAAEARFGEEKTERWTDDPGAIPGESSSYLDVPNGDLDKAKAVMIEHDTGPPDKKFEARLPDGTTIGRFETGPEARAAAEKHIGQESTAENYTADQIEDAELGIRSELGMRQAGTTPGRYYIENEPGEYNPQRERSASKGVTSGGHWLGVKGLQNLKYTAGFTPTEIETALRRRAGRVYDTLIKRAVRSPEEIERATSFNPQEIEGGLASETGLRPGPQIALPEEETPKPKKKARK